MKGEANIIITPQKGNVKFHLSTISVECKTIGDCFFRNYVENDHVPGRGERTSVHTIDTKQSSRQGDVDIEFDSHSCGMSNTSYIHGSPSIFDKLCSISFSSSCVSGHSLLVVLHIHHVLWNKVSAFGRTDAVCRYPIFRLYTALLAYRRRSPFVCTH